MERGQAELMAQRMPAGSGGGINLGASLAITAVLTVGLFLIFRSGVLGAPKPPAGGPRSTRYTRVICSFSSSSRRGRWLRYSAKK